MSVKDMLAFEELPVILVSALDTASALSFITELIDDEVSDVDSGVSTDRVWRITNKYYTAEVRLHPIGDGEALTIDPEYIEAHIIYLSESEGEEAARSRWARTPTCAGVRVAVGAWETAPGALCLWCARLHLEVVPLQEQAPTDHESDPDEPFPETFGVERVRAALHAHAWRGMRTKRGPLAPLPLPPSPQGEEWSRSSSDGEGLYEADDERAVERAEAFALALAALPSREELYAEADEDTSLRRQRAEAMASLVARALGFDFREY